MRSILSINTRWMRKNYLLESVQRSFNQPSFCFLNQSAISADKEAPNGSPPLLCRFETGGRFISHPAARRITKFQRNKLTCRKKPHSFNTTMIPFLYRTDSKFDTL
jgi:hypothetical protein